MSSIVPPATGSRDSVRCMTADGQDWAIAALAVSAVMGDVDRDTAIAELTSAAHADADLLDRAQGRVHGLKLGDDATRRQAADLLGEAAVRIRHSL